MASATYQRHRPEDTPLHAIVREHFPSFLTHAQQGGRRLPRYVEREFRAYVECGILAHGFSRARCSGCSHEIVVAFSCKKRGICPSCNARRMSDTAARLTDHVLPDLRLRQWVLSVPFELRLLLAANPRALSAVGKIFCQEIARWQRERARSLGYRVVRGGVICFPQRFGGSLNLNVHYHAVAPDAAFAKVGERIDAVALQPPTAADLDDVVMNTALRVIDWLRRKGFLRKDVASEEAPSPLMQCLQGSLGVGQLHHDTGEPAVSTPTEPQAPRPKKGMLAEYLRFNVHAGVSVQAGWPQERERLLRYCARAPLSLERLRILDDGCIAYQVKHPYRGRAAVRVMTPIQFMARPAALVPPPRHPLIRFHGVFAPNNKWRSAIVPAPALPGRPACSQSREGTTASAEPAATPPQNSSNRPTLLQAVDEPKQKLPTRIDWATLLRRVYDIDALACTECGGRLRFIELIEDKAQARELLEAMGLPCQPPPIARARAPDWDDN